MNKKIQVLLALISFCAFVSAKELTQAPEPQVEQKKPILEKKALEAPRVSEWQKIEEKSKNAVAQIFSQSVQFNWSDPYKAPAHIQAAGTGFFIDAEGHLLTNYHVVASAVSVQISIPALGKQLLETTVIGTCPELDVALLKLTPESIELVCKELKNIPYLEFDDSDKLIATEPILALGYPLGFRYLKTTVGVVAGREFLDGYAYVHITAPLNPGNSGGPALNKNGKVVGINSAIIENAQNIGYIIPINNVKVILKNLFTTPLVRKPLLGARFNPTTKEHAQALGNPWPAGVHIFSVIKNSVADKAGLKSGDMLYKIAGHMIDPYGDIALPDIDCGKISLGEFLLRFEPYAKAEIEFYRNGKKLTRTCTFDPTLVLPVRQIYPEYEPEEIAYEMIGGMCVMSLRLNHFEFLPQRSYLQDYTSYEKRHKEVLVIVRILPGSLVHKTNCLYEGALLSKVNNKPVSNLQEFTKALQESVKTGYISLETKDKYSTVVSLDKVLVDEKRLARDFMFTPTQTVKDIEQARAQILKKK